MTLTILICLGVLLALSNLAAMDNRLAFCGKGQFKIVQFTDIHWDSVDDRDEPSARLMKHVLDTEEPDLVVFTGDNLSGECVDSAQSLRQCLQMVIDSGTPWAITLGNHDDEGTLTRRELMELAQSLDGAVFPLTDSMVYSLPVYSSKTGGVAYTLFCLDSNAYDRGISEYDWIHSEQIAWFRNESLRYRKDNHGQPIPALAFFHIPIPEYDLVWRRGSCKGQKMERVCSPDMNSGFFVAAMEMKNVQGMFVGHDHVNDYEGSLGGIRLCYGRCTGHRPRGGDRLTRGARVILLEEGKSEFQTWIRTQE